MDNNLTGATSLDANIFEDDYPFEENELAENEELER